MGRYPCIGEVGRVPKQHEKYGRFGLKGRLCSVKGCTLEATHYVDVQVSWFRGEDEVYTLCEKHRYLRNKNVKELLRKVG